MKKVKKIKPKKSGEILVTKKLLDLTEQKISRKITSLNLDMRSQFKKVDARFSQVDARFNQVDARFNQMDAKFDVVNANFDLVNAKIDKMNSRLEVMNSQMAQSLALFEDQNSRNRFVLDGYASLDHRMSKIESSEV